MNVKAFYHILSMIANVCLMTVSKEDNICAQKTTNNHQYYTQQ